MWFDATFGAEKTSLATVGYRLYNNTGGDAQARTTTGVVEIGNGAYGVEIASLPAGSVGIEWDTGEATPSWAHENIGRAADAVWGQILEGTLTAEQIQRILLSGIAAKSSEHELGTPKYRDQADGKDRINAVTDEFGNRTSVTLDGT